MVERRSFRGEKVQRDKTKSGAVRIYLFSLPESVWQKANEIQVSSALLAGCSDSDLSAFRDQFRKSVRGLAG